MIKSLKHLSARDKQALAIFFGLALVCALYFASGILVTDVSTSAGAMEVAKDGRGFTVSVSGLQTYVAAERLKVALQDQRHVPAAIEAAPVSNGYLLKIGPLAKRADAETLTTDLYTSGYSGVKITENCPPGTAGNNGCAPNKQ